MKRRETSWMFLESLLLRNARVCALQVNTREEQDTRESNDLSCQASALDDFAALFLRDAWRLGKV
jgi:hypothetical protein